MAVYIVMIISWLVFFVGFGWFRFRRPNTREKRRDRVSVIGILLQGAGYAIIWVIERRRGLWFHDWRFVNSEGLVSRSE